MAKKPLPAEGSENPETSEAPELEEPGGTDSVEGSGGGAEQAEEVVEEEKYEAQVPYYTQLRECATILSNKLDADIILYNGPIDSPHDRRAINLCCEKKNRTNVFLIMVTGGGDPNAAFRIARHLQLKYEKIYFCASGLCKSSGTLIAIGASELIISDFGELGPLDVQIYKKDRLGEMQSGWTADSAIKYLLNDAALDYFFKVFFDTIYHTRRTITVPTASKIAVNLAVGLVAPILQQIDPMHVGEMSRALDIAWKYGRMLSQKPLGKEIIDDKGLKELISEYPSHDFVIDRATAITIFKEKCVREPIVEEQNLLSLLGRIALEPLSKDDPLIDMLSNPKPTA